MGLKFYEYIAFDLQLHGASVTAVSSASAALQILPDLKPDVLVSDIGMPEIDGYQMLRQIRASQADSDSQIPALSVRRKARLSSTEGNRTYGLCWRNRTTKSLRSRFSNASIQTSRSKRSCCSSC